MDDILNTEKEPNQNHYHILLQAEWNINNQLANQLYLHLYIYTIYLWYCYIKFMSMYIWCCARMHACKILAVYIFMYMIWCAFCACACSCPACHSDHAFIYAGCNVFLWKKKNYAICLKKCRKNKFVINMPWLIAHKKSKKTHNHFICAFTIEPHI